MSPQLSILIPSVPSRRMICYKLFDKLNNQIQNRNVEILVLLDNKKRSIGLKRDALLHIANGDFIAFVDDDDDVSDDYIDSILNAIESNPSVDIITFKQIVQINGENPFTVDFSINHVDNQQAYKNNQGLWQDLKRRPFHVCIWARRIASKYHFPDASYGEDWHWAQRVLCEVKTETKIDKQIHYYFYNSNITEAELIYPKE